MERNDTYNFGGNLQGRGATTQNCSLSQCHEHSRGQLPSCALHRQSPAKAAQRAQAEHTHKGAMGHEHWTIQFSVPPELTQSMYGPCTFISHYILHVHWKWFSCVKYKKSRNISFLSFPLKTSSKAQALLLNHSAASGQFWPRNLSNSFDKCCKWLLWIYLAHVGRQIPDLNKSFTSAFMKFLHLMYLWHPLFMLKPLLVNWQIAR